MSYLIIIDNNKEFQNNVQLFAKNMSKAMQGCLSQPKYEENSWFKKWL